MKKFITIAFLLIATAASATVVNWGGNTITGLSSDSKPTNVSNGSRFLETDTVKWFVKSSGTWTSAPDQVASGMTFSAISANTATTVQAAITNASVYRLFDHTAHSIYSSTSSTGCAWTTCPLAEVSLATFTIPGGSMGANGIIRVLPLFSYTSAANNKAVKLSFGGTLFHSNGAITTSKSGQMYKFIRNRNSVSSQIGSTVYDTNGDFSMASNNLPATGSVNTAVDQALNITGQTTLETGFTPVTTNMSGNGTTVTVIYTAHGLNTGEYVQAAGSSTAGYNVDPVMITKVDANTFNYLGTGTGTPVTSPTIKRYSVIQLESIDVEIVKQN